MHIIITSQTPHEQAWDVLNSVIGIPGNKCVINSQFVKIKHLVIGFAKYTLRMVVTKILAKKNNIYGLGKLSV